MNKITDLKNLDLTQYNVDDIAIKFKNTTFYYGINNIYGVYKNDLIVAFYDANLDALIVDNFTPDDIPTEPTTTLLFFDNISISKNVAKYGLITTIEELCG